MKLNYFLLLMILFAFSAMVNAQNITCSDFTVLDVYSNPSNPSESLVDIQNSVPSNVYIGYPHVSSVLDCNGDTISNGIIFYPGYFGDTNYVHPTSLIDTTACLPLTIIFVYTEDFVTYDTCYFNYGIASQIENSEITANSFIAYPNPLRNGQLNIKLAHHDFYSLKIINSIGETVLTLNQLSSNATINCSTLSKGVYFLQLIQNNNVTSTKKFIIE